MTEPRTTDPGPPTDLWEDDAWEDLLAAIGEQQVVPIVGPDLVIVELGGVRETLERYVTRELIGRLPWPGARPEPGATLNDVASSFTRSAPDPERQRKTISREIIRLLQETDFPTPEPLRKLAEITPLRLFVNLTFDGLLEQTLQQVRCGVSNDPDGKDQGVISCIYKINFVQDIGLTPQEMQQTRVYNLFGRVSPSAPYVLTDEDLLEHIRYFQVESTRPKNLFDELNRSNLLFLGEGYSDWLARFFIRSTKSTPLSWQRPVREFMADGTTGRDAGLVSFLRRFSRATQVSPKGGVEFVDDRAPADSAFDIWFRRDSTSAAAELSGSQAGIRPGMRAFDRSAGQIITELGRRFLRDSTGKSPAEPARLTRSSQASIARYREGEVWIHRQIYRRTETAEARDSLGVALGNLSWTYLLTGRRKEAAEAAAEGLKLSPAQTYIIPNWFNGVLLSAPETETQLLFTRFAGQDVEDPKIRFECAVLRDLAVLHRVGVASDQQVQIAERLVAKSSLTCPTPGSPTP